jgi:hypothetical protein
VPPASRAAPATGTPVALGSGPAAALQQQYEEVIKTVLPSVVQINTDAGTGSGVIYDTKGRPARRSTAATAAAPW